MRGKKLLFIGYGDIASRCTYHFTRQGWDVTGVARTAKPVMPGLTPLQGEINQPQILQKIAEQFFNIVIITLTPGEFSDKAYHRCYVESSRKLVDLWQTNSSPPELVIFVSSTSVYAQEDGEWIDETSATTPQTFAGTRLLEAEELWRNSSINTCIVRFSGIYGNDRRFLIDQVKAGKPGSSSFTNRIHVDDCVGILIHLCTEFSGNKKLKHLYLASDNEPVPGYIVRQWLASQLGLDSTPLNHSGGSVRGGNKKCDNKLICKSGYNFVYPTYREGYSAVLQKINEAK